MLVEQPYLITRIPELHIWYARHLRNDYIFRAQELWCYRQEILQQLSWQAHRKHERIVRTDVVPALLVEVVMPKISCVDFGLRQASMRLWLVAR